MTARRLWLRRREAAVPRQAPPPVAELARVAAEQDHPRLTVWHISPGYWCWRIDGPGGELLDSGTLPTHAQALAVGLAALEQASVTGPRP